MNLTDDEILKFQKGSPVFIDDICAIYSPKLSEIIDIGYSKFEQYLSVITLKKPLDVKDRELEQLLDKLTDFQYMLLLIYSDKEMNQILKEAFMFFTHESVTFSLEPAQIVIGPLEEKHLLSEDKFYDFQKIVKHMCFLEQDAEEIVINSNDSPQVVRLKKQMMKNREKLRKAKAKKAAQEKTNLSFSDLIGSLTLNHCNLNMENVWNITYYAFHDQLKRMGWRDQFDINNRAAMAGAKLKKNQLKHWMRSITDSDKS